MTFAGFNVGSPFGRIVSYEPIAFKGFILHPKSDEAPNGWTYTPGEDGAAEKPGAPGGGAPYRFIGKPPAAQWNCHHTPGTQFVGEIDWKGKQKSAPRPHYGHYRLSYHGPASRHFASEAFTYGGDDSHNNIYCEGKCIAVAPYPVLGACLREVETEESKEARISNPALPQIKEWWVFVVCKQGGTDAIYKRRQTSGVLRGEYTEEFRAASMKTYDEKTNPEGWVPIGFLTLTFGSQGTSCQLAQADTPWFFNESGTVAVCVRRCSLTLDAGARVGSITRPGYNVHRIQLTEDGYTHTDLRNDGGFNYDIVTTVEEGPELVVDTKWPIESSPTLSHSWDTYRIDQRITCIGEYTVGVDFSRDTMLRLKVVVNYSRWHRQNMYYGTDPVPHPTTFQVAHSNHTDKLGDWYNYEGPQNGEWAGQTETWLKVNDKANLKFDTNDVHWLYRRLSGSFTEFSTGEPDPDDQALYFVWLMDVYPHHLDSRNGHLAVFTEEKVNQQRGSGADVFTFETEQRYYAADSSEYEKFMEKKGDDVYSPGSTYTGVGTGWLYSKLIDSDYSIGNTDRVAFKDVDIPIPPELDAQWPANVPKPSDFYYGKHFTEKQGMLSMSVLLHSISKSYREGGFGVDDFGNAVMSMKYKDHEDKERYYNYVSGGDLSSITLAYGENQHFYKLGVV